MGMTIAEKILARASGKRKVLPGDYVVAKPDRIMVLGERIGELTATDINSRWPKDIKLESVSDPDRIVVISEHVIPPDNVHLAQLYHAARAGVKKLGIKNFFDIGRGGICHQVFSEKGFARPGELVVGSDSHTCTYGAFNTAARGINYELPYVLKTGATWFRVPETIKIVVNGELGKGVCSKDIILKIMALYGTEIALYKSVEFAGDTISALDVSSRMTMANMGVEMGAKFALFECDKKLEKFLSGLGIGGYESVVSDHDAEYDKVIELNVSDLEPQVACPHDLANTKDVSKVADTKIDQAFLGTCTNGRYDDLKIAADIIRGKKIHPDVRLVVTPASQEVYKQALEGGIIKVFMDADAVVTNATCGACAGLHLGVIGPGEVCIGTQNRNFKGRMGSDQAEVYLGSPATVAASALNGVITDPREYL